MLWKLLKPFIYPFEISFFIEGPAERNFQILNEFIDLKSFNKTKGKKEEIVFYLPIDSIALGWGWGSALCTFSQISENGCKMNCLFYKHRYLFWGFFGFLSFLMIFIGVADNDFSKILWLPALFLIINLIGFGGSILPAFLFVYSFFKNKLFVA